MLRSNKHHAIFFDGPDLLLSVATSDGSGSTVPLSAIRAGMLPVEQDVPVEPGRHLLFCYNPHRIQGVVPRGCPVLGTKWQKPSFGGNKGGHDFWDSHG
jgi:hypothetical protein